LGLGVEFFPNQPNPNMCASLERKGLFAPFPIWGKWVFRMEKKKSVWAVKIDERGRITIPKDLLDTLGITSGDSLAFVREEEGPICVGKVRVQVEIPFTKKPEGESLSTESHEKPRKASRREMK
jgi:AbrB family looped-hinge helix DNA binding protein